MDLSDFVAHRYASLYAVIQPAHRSGPVGVFRLFEDGTGGWWRSSYRRSRDSEPTPHDVEERIRGLLASHLPFKILHTSRWTINDIVPSATRKRVFCMVMRCIGIRHQCLVQHLYPGRIQSGLELAL